MGQGIDDKALPPFAGDADLARLAADGAALILVAANGTDVIWASPAGARLIGAPDDGAQFRFTTGLAPIERLAKLATETAPVEGARLERLRFVNGRHLSVVTVAARRGALPDGQPAVLLTIAGQKGAPASLPAFLSGVADPKTPTSTTAKPSQPQTRLRFTFQLDAEGRLTSLGENFLALLPADLVVLNQTAATLADTGRIEIDASFADALAARETFHSVTTHWPSREGVWLKVDLSATPIHDPAQGFSGYRGFGVCQFTDRALPPPKPKVAPAPEPRAETPTSAPVAEEGRLSQNEREAFRQIARALGALAGQDDAKATPRDEAPVRPNTPSQNPERTIETPRDDAARMEADLRALQEAMAQAEREASLAAAPQPDDDGIEEGEFVELGPTDLIAWPMPSSSAKGEAEPIDRDSLAHNAVKLFDRLPIGVMVSRGDVPIVMNRTLLDMLDYRDIDQFFDAGGLDALFRGRSADQIGMAAQGGDIALARRDGGLVAAEARMQTIQWGDLPATLMIFRRPSDDGESAGQATLELELRRRETELQELHAVLDTATDGIVMLDGDGRIMAMNRSAEALFGYDQNEVAGEAFITLLAPESHAAAIDYIEGLRAGGVAAVLNDGRELLGRERQGGSIPLFTTIGRIGPERDLKYCIVMRDITPWKKAEADLVAAKRAAEFANAQKSDFLARMSHEIRTPMSAIMGFAEVMLDERFGPIGNERYRDYLKDMHTSGAHVISLINDLLDISKIEAGRADLTFIKLDLNDAATKAASLMQNEARRGRVILRMNLEETLPAIVADDRSIRQVFLNLLSNAIKFSEAGGEVIVSTTLSERGEVVLRIRDNGIGMREEDIATALEPFRQVGTTRRAGGTGLGLPLTKALVEANRASLSIRSAPDKGTLVEVIFPPNRVLVE